MRTKSKITTLKSKVDNPKSPPAPGRKSFRKREWEIIQKYKTPRQVHALLRGLPYNWEKNGETLRTFRGVVRTNTAHCLEAVLAAATILEQHGYPPWVLDIESQDNIDHVLFLFKHKGLFGTVARSRDAGLHGRKPVFPSIRQLVMSYADPYVDFTGRIVGYGVADLRTLVKVDWRLSEKNVWAVQNALIAMPHKKIGISDRRYESMHSRFIAFKNKFPDRPATFYSNRNQWM